MSKTETLLNDMGHTLDEDPRPLLYVGPTEKNVRTMSDDRVSKMLRSVPSLWNNLLKGQKNKTAEKYISGVRIGFAWAGSPTELASHPAARIYIDERDRMRATSEGDVDSILSEAVATYAGIIIRVSTPLLGNVVRDWDKDLGRDCWRVTDPDEVSSPIWRKWQQGTRHEWAVACIHCDEFFIIHKELLKYDESLEAHLVGPTARVVCPCCGSEHTNNQKEKLNSTGVFIAPGEVIEKHKAKREHAIINGVDVGFGAYLDRGAEALSFWVSGLCSPWSSWERRATEIFKAKESKDNATEQGVVNTQFGEVYKPRGNAPDWDHVRELKKGYNRLDVPDWVQVITAGVDVHKKRLNYVLRGWGYGYESCLIDWGELWGDCKYLNDSSWKELRTILGDLYGDRDLPISLMLIDSGYKPNDDPADASVVYQFCYANKRAAPAKGHDSRTRPYSASSIDISYKGKSVKDGLKLWHLDSDVFKQFIYSRYEWEEDQGGGWHLPADVDEEYCRQVSAEARTVLADGRARWEKTRQDNHFFDCEYMSTAAAHILRLHRLKDQEGNTAKKTARKKRRVHRSIKK